MRVCHLVRLLTYIIGIFRQTQQSDNLIIKLPSNLLKVVLPTKLLVISARLYY